MILELQKTIPLITPKGKGMAHFVIDYSQEHDLLWVCFLDENGECWTFRNDQIRLQPNLSLRPQQNEQIPFFKTYSNLPE